MRTPSPSFEQVLLRFPALRRLSELIPGRGVPIVMGQQLSDCGAACLAMTLRVYGADHGLSEVHSRLGSGRDGCSAYDLVVAAQSYGLHARAIRLDLDDLEHLQRGAILHWELKHFIVFSRMRGGALEVVDPSVGYRVLSREEYGRGLSGIAVVFERTPSFRQIKRVHVGIAPYVSGLLSHQGLLARIFALSLLAQVFGLVLPLVTAIVVDRIVPQGDLSLLGIVAAGACVMGVFVFSSGMLRAYLLLELRVNLDLQIALGFVDHLVRLPMSFFATRQPGDMMMRLNSNASIRELVTSGALSAILDGTLIASYIVVLLLAHVKLAMVTLSLGVARVAIYWVSRLEAQRIAHRERRAQAHAADFQIQMLMGLESLKVAGAEDTTVNHWIGLYIDVINASLQRGRLQATVQGALAALAMFSPVVLLCYGASLVLSEQMSLGAMLAICAIAAGFLGPLTSLVSTAISFQELGSYVERIEDVMQTPREGESEGQSQTPRLSGAIDLQAVSFAYHKHGRNVVQNVSVMIPAGGKIGIVGRSGSGKSSLARLLGGLYQPSSGDIRFDGVSMQQIELRTLRSQIGFVPQMPYVFGSTIRDNIALGIPGMSMSDIERAAERAGLLEDILGMPMGFDTRVVAGGGALSGGQRQRLAIARAIARPCAVVILDEATSEMDSISEAVVNRSIRDLACTRVVIAHRLSSIVDSDLILVMHDGRLVEQGTHAHLAVAGGVYAQLTEAQRTEDVAAASGPSGVAQG